jgi:hypothetical protein
LGLGKGYHVTHGLVEFLFTFVTIRTSQDSSGLHKKSVFTVNLFIFGIKSLDTRARVFYRHYNCGGLTYSPVLAQHTKETLPVMNSIAVPPFNEWHVCVDNVR